MNDTELTWRDVQTLRVLKKAREDYEIYYRAFPPRTRDADGEYKFGHHTNRMLALTNEAVHRVEGGESVFMGFCLPFRHGKSDSISRRLPGFCFARHPEWEIMLASYNARLAQELGADARQHIGETGPLFGYDIRRKQDRRGGWKTTEGGALYAAGLLGTSAGRGGNVIIIDDYFKNRLNAESLTIRNRVWDGFGSDFMTRRAPVCLVIIVANRWGPDDLVARIKRKNNPDSEEYDPDFPVFEFHEFPAFVDEKDAAKYGYSGWLHPERYSEEWYRHERAMLSSYAWNAQGQQDPQPRTGNMLRVDMVMEDEHFPEGLKWAWAWDVASSEKEVASDDPDFSVGTRMAWKDPDLYIDSVVYGRWKALERDRKIKNHAERGAPLFVEAVGGYKDMVEYVKKLVAGIASSVEGMGATRDLVARASVRAEALFESGHVHVRKGAKWLPFWKRQIGAFPSSHEHDDCVASLVTGLEGIIGTDDEWGFSR